MVYCCVPQCGTDSWRCDPSISFHDFPSIPDLAAKWIEQINNGVKTEKTWFPKGKSVVCSKHFLSTDYQDDSETLKPRVVPTIFGHKYIGINSDVEEINPPKNQSSAGPVIVKIKTEDGGKQDILITGVYSQNSLLEAIINEPENLEHSNSQSLSVTTPTVSKPFKTYSNMVVQQRAFKPTYQDFSPNVINIPIKKPKKITPLTNNDRHQTLQPEIHEIPSNSSTTPNKTAKTPKKVNKTPKNQNKVSEKSKAIKKPVQKRDNNDTNLIEIGPNTFLKINPEIIKVNKKQTPSGNTVLQFLMDQKLANSIGTDVLPKIVQGAISNIGDATSSLRITKANIASSISTNENEAPSIQTAESPKTDGVVQHVVGHLVDTHVCKESCANLQEMDLMETDNIEQEKNCSAMNGVPDDMPEESTNLSPIRNEKAGAVNIEENPSPNKQNEVSTNKADSSCIAKAPILLTTNMPLAHCFMEKTKYLTNLRQKARQIASLKQKVVNLNKKIEELEDRCIVQERQLSFSFLKKLRTIRKNASKGDPPATYILEQIRAYTGQKQMRWSDSTLQQCAVWCKKAPYAYEYFKKADFFKLPCLGTVKRFMKKHPEMTFSNKTTSNVANDDGESSSDFNFDEEDSTGELDNEMKGNQNGQIICESVMSEETDASTKNNQISYQKGNLINPVGEQNMANTIEVIFQNDSGSESNTLQTIKTENASKSETYPVTVDGTSLEVQELILPSGEVVQCYSSNSGEPNSQYYIIPSTGDTGTGVEHEYSIVQSADSVPVILQNLENSNLQQEQLIFITNSSDQVECTETEVMTAR